MIGFRLPMDLSLSYQIRMPNIRLVKKFQQEWLTIQLKKIKTLQHLKEIPSNNRTYTMSYLGKMRIKSKK